METHMSINWQIYKQNVYPNNGILFSHKKEQSTGIYHNINKPWNNHAQDTTYVVPLHEVSMAGRCTEIEMQWWLLGAERREWGMTASGVIEMYN
jgi:hypothetical protein